MKRKEFNILLLGNGFDLAHGLPTSYIDFIKFSKYFFSCFNQATPKNYIEKCVAKNVDSFVSSFLVQMFVENKNESSKQELKLLLKNNVWYNHFLARDVQIGSTWIDFESEIAIVIQALYRAVTDFDSAIQNWDYLAREYPSILGTKPKKIQDVLSIKDTLIVDLKRITRAIELYLAEVINSHPVLIRIPEMQQRIYDKVICFNYTNTFERLYQIDKKSEIDYLHGKAQTGSSLENNNMILGIDEFVPFGIKTDTDFIEFKKYYQRIWKKTGNLYYKWLKEIRQNNHKSHIYIFGHSLDETDKDILCPYLCLDNADVTIYYHSKQAFGEQIKKLVNLLGEEDLVEKVHEEKIVFVQQQVVNT